MKEPPTLTMEQRIAYPVSFLAQGEVWMPAMALPGVSDVGVPLRADSCQLFVDLVMDQQ